MAGLLATGLWLVNQAAVADDMGNADVVSDVGCMQDEAGFGLNCTANDVQLASAQNITIIDDGCAYIGDLVTFSADFEVLLTAQARHDIGIWFAQDGDPNGDAAVSGMCTVATPAYAPEPDWLDLDGTSDDPDGLIQDTCGDIDDAHNPLFPAVTLTVVCEDGDGDGQLDLPNCTSWRQPGANELCTSPVQAFPGAPSKCRCDVGFNVAIGVPGEIALVDKVTLDADGNPLPGDPTVFEFTLDGPDADLPVIFTLTGDQDPFVPPRLDAGTYTLVETPVPGWNLVSAVCTSGSGENADQDLLASGGVLTVYADDTLTCTFTNQQAGGGTPALSVDKTLLSYEDLDGSGGVSLDDVLTYQFVATNDGDVLLTGVTIADMLPGLSPLSCTPSQPADLAPGATLTCTATYVVTEEDVLAGGILNTATADSNETDPVSDDEIVLIPLLTVDKELTANADEDGSGTVSLGDTLTYVITATNAGEIDLNNVVVTDDLTGDSTTCAVLAPAATCILTVTYVVTAADVEAGQVVNTGTADSDETGQVEDPNDEPVEQNPSLTLSKTLLGNADEDSSGDVSVNDTLTYRFVALNDGDVTLTGVTIVDPLPGLSALSCDQAQPATLAPGEALTCTATYMVTASDVAEGSIFNTATADSDRTDPVDDSETVPVPTPSLATVKELTGNADEDGSNDVSLGDTLSYTITVTNTGTANLTDVVVSDDLTGDSTSCALVMPGGTCVLETTYVVTAADVAAGEIANTGTGDSDQTDPVDETETVPVPAPNLTIDKQVVSITNPDLSDGGTAVDQASDKITYDLVVTNIGTANLTNVTVDDDLTGTVDALCAAFLAPGDSCTVTVMYTVTQADLDNNGANPALNGFIDNTGTADSTQTDPAEDSEQVPVEQNPSVDLTKTFAEDSVIAGGPGSSFQLVVTNDGNITLRDVLVADAVDPDLTVTGVDCAGGIDASAGQNVSCTFGTLNVDESRTITVFFEVDSAVPETLGLNNTATADGTSDTAGDVTDSDSDTIDILVEIELSITKTFYRIDDEGSRVEDGQVEQGTNGFFELVVSNAGPSDAAEVVVADDVNDLLEVVDVQPQPECAASAGQAVNCTLYIAAGSSVSVTVEYTAAAFLDPDAGPQYGTEEGDEFRIVFVNGYVLEGSTDDGPVFLTDPDGNVEELIFNGTKNDIVFDPPEGGAAFTLHLSCSDPFTGGWGASAGPDEFENSFWQIASYSILRYRTGGEYFKGCGDVVVPWEVDNTAFADGTDSNSPPESEQVSDSDTVLIIRQLKIELRGEPTTKGKKLDMLLSNTGMDSLTITQIEISWPDAANENGSLLTVSFGGTAIYGTPLASSPATIAGPWLGSEADRTIDPGQALKLGFFFARKTVPSGYEVTVTLDGGLTTEVITVTL